MSSSQSTADFIRAPVRQQAQKQIQKKTQNKTKEWLLTGQTTKQASTKKWLLQKPTTKSKETQQWLLSSPAPPLQTTKTWLSSTPTKQTNATRDFLFDTTTKTTSRQGSLKSWLGGQEVNNRDMSILSDAAKQTQQVFDNDSMTSAEVRSTFINSVFDTVLADAVLAGDITDFSIDIDESIEHVMETENKIRVPKKQLERVRSKLMDNEMRRGYKQTTSQTVDKTILRNIAINGVRKRAPRVKAKPIHNKPNMFTNNVASAARISSAPTTLSQKRTQQVENFKKTNEENDMPSLESTPIYDAPSKTTPYSSLFGGIISSMSGTPQTDFEKQLQAGQLLPENLEDIATQTLFDFSGMFTSISSTVADAGWFHQKVNNEIVDPATQISQSDTKKQHLDQQELLQQSQERGDMQYSVKIAAMASATLARITQKQHEIKVSWKGSEVERRKALELLLEKSQEAKDFSDKATAIAVPFIKSALVKASSGIYDVGSFAMRKAWANTPSREYVGGVSKTLLKKTWENTPSTEKVKGWATSASSTAWKYTPSSSQISAIGTGIGNTLVNINQLFVSGAQLSKEVARNATTTIVKPTPTIVKPTPTIVKPAPTMSRNRHRRRRPEPLRAVNTRAQAKKQESRTRKGTKYN